MAGAVIVSMIRCDTKMIHPQRRFGAEERGGSEAATAIGVGSSHWFVSNN
jgi:hypothetical protein